MQEIKQVKKTVNTKRTIIAITLDILPYVPLISIFAVITWLLDTSYNQLVTDILACIGLVPIFFIFWKLSDWLIVKIDKWSNNRYGHKDADDDFIDEED